MNIKIGNVIRDLRGKANVTQEGLANHLGVSVQAVSRWETGACYPDLELVPSIAVYFGVSCDLLLGIDGFTVKQMEEDYVSRWTEAYKNAKHHEALEIVNTALLSMPTNYRLMLLRAQSMVTLAGIAEERGDEEEIWAWLGKAKDTLQLMLSQCRDSCLRCQALEWMIGIEYVKGNKAKALEYIDEFPEVRHSKAAELFRFGFFDENERVRYGREYLYALFFEFFYCARSIAKSSAVSIGERGDILKRLLQILHLVVDDDNSGEFEYLLDDMYQTLYDLTGDEQYKCEPGFHTRKYEALPEKHQYGSVFFDGVIFDHRNTIKASDGSDR